MPQTARALTRAARDRARRTGTTYTRARAAVQAIHELMVTTGWEFAEAEAFYDDPANEMLCETCGWTMGMICPECPGCGCYTGSCTGWRHHEYRDPDMDGLDDDPDACPECGAGGRGDPYGECVCFAA